MVITGESGKRVKKRVGKRKYEKKNAMI